MRRLLLRQLGPIVVFLWFQEWSFAQEPTTPPASSPGDIATYDPQRDNSVRWYSVEDMTTGQRFDNMSLADIGTIRLDDGRTLHLIENRHPFGIDIDYQEMTAEHVLLHRLVRNIAAAGTSPPRPQNTLRDGFFSAPRCRYCARPCKSAASGPRA
ncbi:MAG: hypothetical protein L0Y67_01685 [Gammaproteobacteria bacterium]|nr:hypothetical protein [Gammaproteobacteria bacterium]